MAEPLQVLDFSKLLPGPFCTQVLAGLGLRVIRVELPHWPDMLREHGPRVEGLGYAYWAANRGKESLCLDFRAPAGRAALERLLARSDALVEGFRPGTMEKLGLGYKQLKRRFPRLVYCSITGYGDESRRAGHDINFLAEAGYFASGAGVSPVQLADLSGAVHAAAGILAALLEARRTGKGRRVAVSMTETAREWLALERGWARATGAPASDAQAWWRGREHPFYRLYETADGRRVAVGALEPPFAVDLLRRLGLERLEDDARSEEPARRRAVAEALEAAFRSQPLAHWEALLGDKDCCVNAVRTLEEARARRPEPRGRKPPRLGQDSVKVLRRAGLSAAAIADLKKSGLLGKNR